MGKTNDRKKSIEKKSMEDKVSLEQTTKTEDRSAKEKCAGCV